MDRKKIKQLLKAHPNITNVLICIVNHLPFNNTYKIAKGNNFINHGILKNCSIVVRGTGNTIKIESLCRLIHTKITISGNNNKIIIGSDSLIIDGELYMEDDLGCIEIGENTNICGKTHLAVIEGRKIIIGRDCLFSSSVIIRTGDSHSILDSKGNRINPSKSVYIGNHVWVGNQVTILKGVSIKNDSIVGTGALVTKEIPTTNVIIGGIPAKIVKENISWCGERISIDKERK